MMAGRIHLGGWNPLSAGVPLAWFDASLASTITLASGKVQTWASRVGSYSVTQATALRQPTYSATGWNSKAPAVTFVSADLTSLRATSGGLSTYLTGTNVPFTIVARFNNPNLGSGVQDRLLVWDYTGGSSTTFSADARGTSGFGRIDLTSGGAPVDGAVSITGANVTWAIARDANVSTWVNNALDLNAVAFGSTGTSDTFGLGIATLLGNRASDATLVELIIWSTRISDANVKAAHLYLLAKWG